MLTHASINGQETIRKECLLSAASVIAIYPGFDARLRLSSGVDPERAQHRQSVAELKLSQTG